MDQTTKMAPILRFLIAVTFCCATPLLLKETGAVAVMNASNPPSSSSTTPATATQTLESVTSLTCTADVMKIRVNVTQLRSLYNDTNPAYLSLLDESCTGRLVGDVWSVENPHSQCQTQRKVDNYSVRYMNAVIYKEHGAGPVVREHRWRLDLTCNLRRRVVVSLPYTVSETKNYAFQLQSEYAAEMHLYNDSSLMTELNANQIRAGLGDDLYVKIDLKGDWNVRMQLQKCVARPLPHSLVSYTLIQNGCPTDSETFIVYTKPNSTLFHFKVFEFYAGSTTVYVDCDVVFCSLADHTSRCAAVCH